MKNKIWFRLLLTIIFAGIVFYITLPAINLHYSGFYWYILFIILFYKFTGVFKDLKVELLTKRKLEKPKFNNWLVLGGIGVFLGICLINLIMSPLFNSKVYSKRVIVDETKAFTQNIGEVDFSRVPLLDKDSSQKLGDRVMGQMSELVSQFYVSNLYTQINYNNEIVRVTPLEYDGIIKYFTNRSQGVKGYITVNSVTGESDLIKLDEGMKYMPSALFGENLLRKLRFSYPTKVFDAESFEIDNNGKPFWIVPCIKYSGVGLKRDIEGAIILDPITGDSTYYEVGKIPTWVDHVYNADLVIEQVNDWGRYREGFFNSVFGQKNVVTTTDGYNYTIIGDDVYLYTGITSAASDESNLGFILTNMRTKKTNYYAVPGAEEYSAMGSAEGQVQQMSYESSFPLLINLNNRPTYLLSLKDNAGLVKMYAFVDVVDYQKVVVTDSSKGIEVAAENYLNNVVLSNDNSSKTIEKTIEIKSIVDTVIDGTTNYYITDTNDIRYKVSIKVASNVLPFIKKGDKLTVNYTESKNIKEIASIK